MKKVLNVVVALMMTLAVPSVQAQAVDQSLDSAIAQLNFELTVATSATNPSDESARKKAVDTFMGQVKDLQAKGMSNEAIVKAIKLQMPSAQLAQDIDTLAATAKQNHYTAEQTNKAVLAYMNKAKTTGASWSNGATIAVVTAAVVVLVAVVILSGGQVSVGYYDNGCYYECYDYYYDYYYCC